MKIKEGEVRFVLKGSHFDPDALTKHIEVTPTLVQCKEDQTKCDIWELSSGKVTDQYVDICNLTSNILDILEPKMDKLNEAIQQFNLVPIIEVSLALSREEEFAPSIGFDNRVTTFLGKIGAFVQIDMKAY